MQEKSNWIGKHIDLVIMLSAFASSILWLNGKFNEIEKDITIIKTVMVMRNIMPSDLACAKETLPKSGESHIVK